VNHVNRFRNEEEIVPNAKTTDDRAIARYSRINMNAKALVDFYKCTEPFDENTYHRKFDAKCTQLPDYLEYFYFQVVFHNNFQNVTIFNKSRDFPYRHQYLRKQTQTNSGKENYQRLPLLNLDKISYQQDETPRKRSKIQSKESPN
jgi:hypothetical protein